MTMDKDVSALEAHARSLLLASVGNADARVRSRLNQARQAAVATVGSPVRSSWLRWSLLPATGAACAAALVLVVMLHGSPATKSVDTASTLDVLDLVTDDDALGLMENNDDSSFYEWAAAQGDAGVAGPSGGGGA